MDVDEAENQPSRPATAAALAALLAAPLLLLVAAVLETQAENPLAGEERSGGPWFAQHVLLLAATALLVPAALALMRLARASLLGVLGAGLALLGALGATGIFAMDFVAAELADAGDRDTMRDLYERMLDAPGIRLLDALQVALPLGLLALAAALFHARTVPRWAGAAIALGALLGAPAFGDYVAIGARVLLLAGFGVAAFALVGQPVADAGSAARRNATG